jgi:hypothetical protein
MNDHQQITDVLVRYGTGIDSRDWDLYRSCFTDDCAIDYGALGSWNDSASITEFMRRAHSGPSLHRMGNFVITVEQGRARARSYVDAVVLGPGGRGGAHSIGYYDDELLRTEAGWRISRRRHTSVRLKFLGVLGIIPAGLSFRLAVLGMRYMAASISR